MRKRQILTTLLLAVGLSATLRAAELKVVDVRRNIPLRDEDPVYKDFYINGGAAAGLKPNLVITAVRKTTIRDASGLQSIGELNVPVGQLRVIFVQDNMAVAREYKLLSRDELPMLEQIGVMSGDVLDMKGSFIEKRKPSTVSPAKNTSENRPLPESLPAALTPAPDTQKVPVTVKNLVSDTGANSAQTTKE